MEGASRRHFMGGWKPRPPKGPFARWLFYGGAETRPSTSANRPRVTATYGQTPKEPIGRLAFPKKGKINERMRRSARRWDQSKTAIRRRVRDEWEEKPAHSAQNDDCGAAEPGIC